MNGATADPWVSNSRAPKTPNTKKIGNIQNFFRARMKRHNSCRKVIGSSSKLVAQTFGSGLLALTRHPIGGRYRISSHPQEIFTGKPGYQSHWSKNRKINHPHDDGCNDRPEHES